MATKKKATTTKKSTPKASKNPVGAIAGKQGASSVSSSNKPVYILVIMILATALIVLYNQQGPIKTTPGIKKQQKKIAKSKNDKKDRSQEKDKIIIVEDTIDDDIPGKKEDSIKAKELKVKSVKLYFIKIDSKTENMYLASVKRSVKSDALLMNTLKKLVQGPSGVEKRNGIYTAVPGNVRIRNVRIENQTATIDFNSAIEWGATGTILLRRIDQLVYTATQFDDIKNVIITINGKRKTSFGSDGLSISGPLSRK